MQTGVYLNMYQSLTFRNYEHTNMIYFKDEEWWTISCPFALENRILRQGFASATIRGEF